MGNPVAIEGCISPAGASHSESVTSFQRESRAHLFPLIKSESTELTFYLIGHV